MTHAKHLTYGFLGVALGALIMSTVQFSIAAWQGPTATPPNNNVPAPINVGTVAQTKNANLSLGSGASLYAGGLIAAPQLCIGSDCRTAWPVSGGSSVGCQTETELMAAYAGKSASYTFPNSGQNITLSISANGKSATCAYGGVGATVTLPTLTNSVTPIGASSGSTISITKGGIICSHSGSNNPSDPREDFSVYINFPGYGDMLIAGQYTAGYSAYGGQKSGIFSLSGGSVASKCTTTSGGSTSGDNLGNHTATMNINMGGSQVTNIGTPVNAGDAATKGYVDGKTLRLADMIRNGASCAVGPNWTAKTTVASGNAVVITNAGVQETYICLDGISFKTNTIYVGDGGNQN